MDFENIVNTNIPYAYQIMISNINSLSRKYSFLSVFSIGKTVLKRPIPCIRFGYGPKEVFYSGAIHANEWITTVVLMKFVEDLCKSYSSNQLLEGYNIRNIFNNVSLYIVPMVNPDGVDLVTGAFAEGTYTYNRTAQISRNYPTIPFPSGWKANIRGVDLNLQFPARVGRC